MLEVIETGGLVTIQDAGRYGWRKYGVPASGPMDWFAYEIANTLVGNAKEAAALEIGFGDVTLRAMCNCVVAVTGAGFIVSTFIWKFPLWNSFTVRNGWKINISKNGNGNWAYLAVAGGIQVDPVLGSRSTNLRAGMGMKLQSGDFLKTGKPTHALEDLAARTLPLEKRPVYNSSPVIAVIEGPQNDWFSQDGHDMFVNCEYKVSIASDRMGYRLEGPPIMQIRNANLLSEGMAVGSVQIPADGQPIAMMADCPTTGGYPKIANIIKADLPIFAQTPIDTGKVHFKLTSIADAHSRYRSMISGIESEIEGIENDATFAQ